MTIGGGFCGRGVYTARYCEGEERERGKENMKEEKSFQNIRVGALIKNVHVVTAIFIYFWCHLKK